jgi:hypothetical protein
VFKGQYAYDTDILAAINWVGGLFSAAVRLQLVGRPALGRFSAQGVAGGPRSS